MPKKDFEEGRRKFIATALPTGAIFCLGCKGLMASPFILEGAPIPGDKPKTLEDIGMSAEDVNPKMKSTFIKNFMKGDSVCVERIVLEA